MKPQILQSLFEEAVVVEGAVKALPCSGISHLTP